MPYVLYRQKQNKTTYITHNLRRQFLLELFLNLKPLVGVPTKFRLEFLLLIRKYKVLYFGLIV